MNLNLSLDFERPQIGISIQVLKDRSWPISAGWEAAVNGGSICAERYSATANDLPEIPIRSPKGEK